jgi:hypothetical protein
MRDLILLVVHVVTTVLRLVEPGGVRAAMAESVLTKHQCVSVLVKTANGTCAAPLRDENSGMSTA